MGKRKYKRLHYEDRQTIEAMSKQGSSVSDIAEALGTHRDTIYREFKRCNATLKTYTAEIHTANMLGIAVIDANQIKRHLEYEEKRQERAASDYAKLHSCEFCKGSKLYSCTGYDCREPYRRAYEYALSRIRERQET